MYRLEVPGYAIESAKLSEADLLGMSHYPCIYWLDYLCDLKRESLGNSLGHRQIVDLVNDFLRKKYLYWLEGLSLYRSVAKGVVSIQKL
jgi:hypothetical protein